MASPVSGSPTSSPLLHRTGFPTFAAVTAAANAVFSEAASQPSAPPLQGRTIPSDVIHSQLEKADQEYEKGNLEGAYSFYRAALATFDSSKEQPDADFFDPSNIPAACCIGIAKTCHDSEKEINVLLAEQALKKVYQNKAKWDELGPEDKSFAYYGLRRNLDNFKLLIPQSRHAEFYPLIEDCKKHIPSIDIANYELMQGQKLFRQKDINGARAAYEEAITHAHRVPVEDTLTVEYRTLTTSIYISYANAHEENDEERIRHCGTAYAQIISLETAIRRSPSENAYQTLLSLCNHLMKLVPKNTKAAFDLSHQ